MYTELTLLEKLQNAYGASTMNCNRFAALINKIAWDEKFKADGESYFVKGKLVLTVQDMDPFKQLWKPSFMIGTYSGEF